MIFVTVGTHEQQFNRLVKAIDDMKISGEIDEDVVIQTGFSTYEPKACTWSAFYSYPEMEKFVENARIVITHGGPSSFFMPLQKGKIPIVVPRRKKYGEHVNDHQVAFFKAVGDRLKDVIVVYDTKELVDIIRNYDNLVSGERICPESNNEHFCNELEKIVEELIGK